MNKAHSKVLKGHLNTGRENGISNGQMYTSKGNSTTNDMLSAILWTIALVGSTGIVWVLASLIRSIVGV